MGTAQQTVTPPALMIQSRTLGEELAPPRQLYFTFIPAILALTGILSWIVGDELGLAVASVIASVVAFFTLWQWLFRHAPTRLSTLMGMTLLLGYGFGTLNTLVTLPRGSLTLGEYAGLSEGILARGLAAVLISSATLYFLGEIFEKPIFGLDFHFQITPRTRNLIYLGAIASLIGYQRHWLDVGGATSAAGHASIPGMFLSWLYTPLTAITGLAFISSRRRVDSILTGLSALVLLAMFSVRGRRITFYTSIEIILVLGLAGFRWREKLTRNILMIAALAAMMVVGSLTFMLLRITPHTVFHHQASIGKRLQGVGKLVQRNGANQVYELASKSTQQNFQTRTFILAFFANILDASSRTTPALGNDAFDQLLWTIPSVIFPDKPAGFSEENLVDQQFGFSYGDEANSVLTGGATDFGLIGVLLYPLVIVFVSRVIFDLMAKRFGIVPLMFAALAFIYQMLQTETTLTGYFECLRDTLLFCTGIAIFMALPGLKLRSS